MRRIDEWRRRQEDLPSRAEAIRRLVELGLTVKTKGTVEMSKLIYAAATASLAIVAAIAFTLAIVTTALAAPTDEGVLQKAIDNVAMLSMYVIKCNGELTPGASRAGKQISDIVGPVQVIAGALRIEEATKGASNAVFCEAVRKTHPDMIEK
jgi:hypothetical protein